MVFDAVVRLFLASVSRECLKVLQNYEAELGMVKFSAQKQFIKDPGFMEILYG
jgi:DNA topoisomerase IA